MIETKQILFELEQNTKNLLDTIRAFDPGKFSTKPSDAGWSAAEVTEHMLKVTVYVNHALKSKTVLSERPFDQKIKMIIGAMNDRSASYKAPEMALPGKEPLKQEDVIAKFKSERLRMTESVAAVDLTLFVSEFKHPGFGGLTGIEWIYFEIHHTQRHLEQLNKIK